MMDQLCDAENLLADLIAFPTISSDSNLALISWAQGYLTKLGARCDLTHDATGTKANLFATFGPDRDGGLVLSGHSDVVPVGDQDWTVDPFTLTLRDEALFGRGACDMKGFIACVLAVAPDIAKWPLIRPLHIALTYDEEVGCLGAQTLLNDLRIRGVQPAMAILGEPTMMRIVTGHKGCFEYSTHIKGLAGHGSTPDLGVNAAVIAARYVARLMELAHDLRHRTPADSPFDPPWSTINIGRLDAGIATNVIPEQAQIDWEMRPVVRQDADYVLSEIDTFAKSLLPEMQSIASDAAILREVIGEVAGLHPVENNETARILMAQTGANGTDVVSFGTEAGLFQDLGMDCVVCGPGSIDQAHKADEFVTRDQLRACLTMLEGLQVYLTNT